MSSTSPYQNRGEVEPIQSLPDEQIDLWEHASLLYHETFDWQLSIDSFQQLAALVNVPQEQALCLLNAGLIQARLGDFGDALGSFEESLIIHPSNAIVPFLFGLVECQLGNHIKAEACFLASLNELKGCDDNYHDLRFDFTLKVADVLHNIEVAQDRDTLLPILATIPAEVIFEAPARETRRTNRVPSISETSISSIATTILNSLPILREARPSSLTSRITSYSVASTIIGRPSTGHEEALQRSTPLATTGKASSVSAQANWRPLISARDAERIACQLLRDIPATTKPGAGNHDKTIISSRRSLRRKAKELAKTLSAKHKIKTKPEPELGESKDAHEARVATLPKPGAYLRSTVMIPRDAKIGGNTTRALVSFIRNEDPAAVPMSGAASVWSVQTSSTLSRLIDDYANLPESPIFSDGPERQHHVEDSASVKSVSGELHDDGASITSSAASTTLLNLDDTYMTDDELVERQRKVNPQLTIHTPGSSSSSLYEVMNTPERKETARARALQNLEGNSNPTPCLRKFPTRRQELSSTRLQAPISKAKHLNTPMQCGLKHARPHSPPVEEIDIPPAPPPKDLHFIRRKAVVPPTPPLKVKATPRLQVPPPRTSDFAYSDNNGTTHSRVTTGDFFIYLLNTFSTQ